MKARPGRRSTTRSPIVRLRSGEPGYPSDLAAVLPPTRLVRLRGDASLLLVPRLGVVGTRTPTRAAAALVRKIVGAALESGFAVVSGLAPGVDAIAHETALQAGGRTLAAVSWGLDRPPGGARGRLAAGILAAGGLLMSVFPDGAPESPARRLYRNRVIAALSGALVLVASEPGGGAWAARAWALRLGRPVLSPLDPRPVS